MYNASQLFAGQAVMMFTLDFAVELPLERRWQPSSESSKDSRHGERALSCSARESIPEVYHVDVCPRARIAVEGPRRKLNRPQDRLSRSLSFLSFEVPVDAPGCLRPVERIEVNSWSALL